MSFSFEPESELPTGWYATQIRFDDLPATRGTFANSPQVISGTAGPHVGSTIIDGWTTARFHVGSRPIGLIYGQLGEGGGHVHLYASEEVVITEAQEISDLLQVTVDGVPLRCPPLADRLETGPFQGIEWNCDDPGRDGEVVVTLRPLAGTAGLVYGSRETPPTWRIRTGEFFDPYDVPDELFVAVERENP